MFKSTLMGTIRLYGVVQGSGEMLPKTVESEQL